VLDPIGDPSAVKFAPLPAAPTSVPAYVYALVNCFRRDAVDARHQIASWRDWWDVETFTGPRALPGRALGTLEAALLADGVKREKLYPLDVERALGNLEKISDKIGDRWWTSGEQPAVWLDRGEATLAAAWHHRVLAAQFDGRPIDIIWEEGLFVADHWVIPRQATVPDIARDLIAYASTREVQLNLALAVPLGPTNPDAFSLIPARLAPRLPTSPQNVDKLVAIDAAWWAENGDATEQRFAAWRAGRPGTPAP
jgi:putative spermidine/putrescine transport system substrate-binding protein